MQEKTITKVEFSQKESVKKPLRSKKRVVAYARVSTAKDAQENSLHSQQEYYERYIKGHPDWDFAGVYADDGISGLSIRNRESFNRMIQDALDGKFDMVITKSLSRFARNTVDSLMAIRKLKAVGVAVFFEKESINTLDANGEFLITLMSSFAEEESRSISENVKWAVRHRFAHGQYSLPFRIFLGYRKGLNGEIVIDEKEAKVVRYIYWLASQGIGSTSVCALLQKYGIPSPCGSVVWTHNTVLSIIQNEKYMGDARLQKYVTTDFLTKSQKRNEGEAPQYYVENGHPAIIRKAAWLAVQEKRDCGDEQKDTTNPFFGKIHCCDCGGKYGRVVWHSTTTREIVWECSQKKYAKTRCRCSHLYDYELHHATETVLSHLLSRYPKIILDCARMLRSNTSTYSRRLDSNLPGGILFDDVAIRLLIHDIGITAGGYAVFTFLDGSSYSYRLAAKTPMGKPGIYQQRLNRQRMLELHESGVSTKNIAMELGISQNTVASFIKRQCKKHQLVTE